MYAKHLLKCPQTANSQNDYDFLEDNFTRISSQCVVGFNDVMIIRSLLFRSTSHQHYD